MEEFIQVHRELSENKTRLSLLASELSDHKQMTQSQFDTLNTKLDTIYELINQSKGGIRVGIWLWSVFAGAAGLVVWAWDKFPHGPLGK